LEQSNPFRNEQKIRHFTEEDVQKESKQIKRCPSFCLLSKFKLKPQVMLPYTKQMAKMRSSDHSKCWRSHRNWVIHMSLVRMQNVTAILGNGLAISYKTK
jgi:hypothetical protein